MSKHAKTTLRNLATLSFLILLSANVGARAQTGITSAGAYFSPKDNYQHALVSTTGGAVYEKYFYPLRRIFRGELGGVRKIVARPAFFSTADGCQYAIGGSQYG